MKLKPFTRGSVYCGVWSKVVAALMATSMMTFVSHSPPVDARVVVPAKARSIQIGTASWYGHRFHGRRTANGEIFNQHAMTAAHRKLPLGSVVAVTSIDTGRTVTVRINDRGPYVDGRIIDLSRAAAKRLGLIKQGVGRVKVKVLTVPSRSA